MGIGVTLNRQLFNEFLFLQVSSVGISASEYLVPRMASARLCRYRHVTRCEVGTPCCANAQWCGTAVQIVDPQAAERTTFPTSWEVRKGHSDVKIKHFFMCCELNPARNLGSMIYKTALSGTS